jgi:DNA sulfur modification protein DndB
MGSMEVPMATFIPAFRAKMGDLDYFVSVVTLGEASRLVQFVEDVDGWTQATPPELKLQRKLNLQRVERELVPYLVDTDDHFYSALTVEIRPTSDGEGNAEIAFDPQDSFAGGLGFGTLTLDGTETLYALDGQHRLKSIELAIRQRPQLAREHITQILIPFRNVTRSQTLFSDLNRYAKTTSKSISLLFTHREGLAQVTKGLANTVPLLRDRVNMESTSLSVNSRHFITLSTLYEMTKSLSPCFGGEDRKDQDGLIADLAQVWSVLSEVVPEWRVVARNEEHPAYLRQRFLSMHGVAQQSIASAAAQVILLEPDHWQESLQSLSDVDWRLTNPTWQGTALHGGRVNNTSTSVRMLTQWLVSYMTQETKAAPAKQDGSTGLASSRA